MRRRSIILCLAAIGLMAGYGGKKFIAFKAPAEWPEPLYDFAKNPMTSEGIELGRVLFYDPILSDNNTISCASCHSPYNAFTHVDHALSHGINDHIGKRNSPTLMNLAWQKNFMWDGAVNHLDMQPIAPISHPDEMGADISVVVKKLNSSALYRGLFQSAFEDSTVTGEHLLKAISQFMLTLVSADSKYDRMKRGEVDFSQQEMNGFALFKKSCASCHAEPLFTTYDFANNGLPVDSKLEDKGRGAVTMHDDDLFKFKIPTLRNVEFSYPYMHDGRFRKLQEVLKHYTEGIQAGGTLDTRLKNKITLSENEQVDVIAFLLTLSDKEFLFNPDHSFPKKYLLK